MSKSPNNYSDPELRERLKAEIIAGERGGRAGQWSARKAQLLAHEYEAAGGTYLGPRNEAQEHLHEWTEEEWVTKDGEAEAEEGKVMHRYLPREVWEKLSPAEREATEKRKVEASQKGEPFVANTSKAAEATREVRASHENNDEKSRH